MTSGIISAELKLARAAKHLRALRKCIAIYSASKPHKIVLTSKHKKKLNIPRRPPREISILAGEVVYQMRSALDHLAFHLVQLNSQKLPKNWYLGCEFPLRLRTPSHGKPPVPYSAFQNQLPGISMAAFAFIESVQPYYGKAAINNCLKLLAHLSNIDKHRYLNVVKARVSKRESIRFASGVRHSSVQSLDPGAEIYPSMPFNVFWRDTSDRATYVTRRYTALVVFKERDFLGDAVTVPIEKLLKVILSQIKSVVVPAFKKLIKNP